MNQKERVVSSKPSLGKGLASLLPPATPPVAAPSNISTHQVISPDADLTANKDRHPGISMALVDEIVPNQFQPRHQFDDVTIEELSQSIKENGIIQPLIVRKSQKGYQLIAGERRLRAAKLAGLKQVPVVIRRTTDKEALELAIIENIQREDLNCVDTAQAYLQLMKEFSLTQELISEKVGKDRATVANYLRLLRLPEIVQNWLKQGTLSFGHGKALAGLEDEKNIHDFGARSVDQKWSVRELETQIQKFKNPERTQNEEKDEGPISPFDLRLRNLGRDLSKKFSTKVKIRGQEKKGKIVFEYFTPDDLDRILTFLLEK